MAHIIPQAPRFGRAAGLAVFGAVGSLTLRDGGPKARVFARDLAGGEAEDITVACARVRR